MTEQVFVARERELAQLRTCLDHALASHAGLSVLLVGLLLLTAACAPAPTPDAGWTRVTTAPTARGELAAAVAGDRLYVLGGLSGPTARATDLVEVYDLTTEQWQTAAPLPQPLNHLAAAGLDGRVYAFGGSTSFGAPPLATAQVFDPATDTWTAIAGMPEARWGAGAAAADGRLYVVGGVGSQDNASVLEYDPQSDTWSVRAAMPTPREHLAVVAFRGKVYAIGGRDGGRNLDAVEVYEPATDTWTVLTPLPTARSGLAAAVAGDRIVVAGGENPSAVRGRVFPEVEVYDPTSDNWSAAAALPTRRHGLAGASHGEVALFIGGSGRPGALSPAAWSGVVEGYRP